MTLKTTEMETMYDLGPGSQRVCLWGGGGQSLPHCWSICWRGIGRNHRGEIGVSVGFRSQKRRPVRHVLFSRLLFWRGRSQSPSKSSYEDVWVPRSRVFFFSSRGSVQSDESADSLALASLSGPRSLRSSVPVFSEASPVSPMKKSYSSL